MNPYLLTLTYYLIKAESDSVAIRQLTDYRKNAEGDLKGAAHRNQQDITVGCTLFLSFNSHSTNI